MRKRTKFIFTSTLLSVGFLLVNQYATIPRLYSISFLSLLTLFMFRWALSDSVHKNATLLVLLLPALFTLGVGLFWFLLPTNIWARFPIALLYAIGIYVLCLIMNIFAVSTIRTIALSRAAKGVGFVVTLFTAFLLFDAILSFKVSTVLSTLLIYISSFLLIWQGLWTSRLSSSFNKDLPIYSAIFSYFVAIISVVLFFWPVTLMTGSIFLTASIYVLLGLGQAKQEGRLFRQTARDYISIGILVFIMMLVSTNWK